MARCLKSPALTSILAVELIAPGTHALIAFPAIDQKNRYKKNAAHLSGSTTTCSGGIVSMPAFRSAKHLPAIRLPLAIGLFGLCVIALVWGGLIFEARQERDIALSHARTDTANLVIAFREH